LFKRVKNEGALVVLDSGRDLSEELVQILLQGTPQVLPLLGESDQHYPPIFVIRFTLHQPLLNQLIDHPGHGAVGQRHSFTQAVHGEIPFFRERQKGIALGRGHSILSQAALITEGIRFDELTKLMLQLGSEGD
jgi:hypothetical protein